MTSPRRTVRVPTLLVAVNAVEYNLRRPVAPDSPVIVDYLADLPAPALKALWGRQLDGGCVRIKLDQDGTVLAAWEVQPEEHGQAVEHFATLGMRLPTPDEWESACGAGAPTLFRWGDDCPLDDQAG